MAFYPDFYGKGPAACTEVDPDLFFADPEEPNYLKITSKAKKICGTCIYIAECREWAIETNEQGVWGGTSKNERRKIRKQRSSGISNAGRLMPLQLAESDSLQNIAG